MNRAGLALLGGTAALLLGSATAVTAQPTGSRINTDRLVHDPVTGWRYGRCAANFRPEASEALLASAPFSAASEAAFDRVTNRNDDRCYTQARYGGQTLYLDETVLRGQIAQGRYLGKYPDRAPPAIARATASTIPVEVYNQRIRSASNQQAEILRIVGDCVVAADPAGVDRLIRTGVTSDEEGRATGALSEHFGPCLWEGQSIEFSLESLRAALADALYRRSEGRTVMAVAEGSTNE
ncbi:MAG: hypothetical protein ABR601_04070 [Parasphingopyxis sp.]